MDPYPIKNAGILLARVRDEIQPSLHAHGFEHSDRRRPGRHGGTGWIDYSSGDSVFSLHWNPRTTELTAQLLASDGEIQVIGKVTLRETRDDPGGVLNFVQPLVTAVKEFLDGQSM